MPAPEPSRPTRSCWRWQSERRVVSGTPPKRRSGLPRTSAPARYSKDGWQQVGPRLTLNAWLRRVPDGATVAQSTVTGPSDSLYALIPRLAVELLGAQLGESAERLATLVGRPPEAVTTYLAGTRALRAGQYEDAVRMLSRAVEADSTFALAALSLAQVPAVPGELGYYARVWRALPIARTHRASLGRREQAALTFKLVKDRYDTAATRVDMLAAVRAWLDVAPDAPEAWLAYASQLRSSGSVIPVPGWESEARVAFERAWSLDSTTPFLVGQHLTGALVQEDLLWLRRVGPRYLAVTDTLTANWMGNRWVIAIALGDSATVRALRRRAAASDPAVSNWGVCWTVQQMEDLLGLPRSDGDVLAAQVRSRVVTRADSNRLGLRLGL
jgi:hypothetical protein